MRVRAAHHRSNAGVNPKSENPKNPTNTPRGYAPHVAAQGSRVGIAVAFAIVCVGRSESERKRAGSERPRAHPSVHT